MEGSTVCSIANKLLDEYKRGLVKAVGKEDWETAHGILLKIDEMLSFTSVRCGEEVMEKIK